MKKKPITHQVDAVVSRIFWYEIIPLDLAYLTLYEPVKRFLTEEDANNYLCKDHFLEPHKFKVIKVIAG